MAVRGRKPTATVIKLATGNPGRRPLPKHEPESAGRPVKPPKIGKRAGEPLGAAADPSRRGRDLARRRDPAGQSRWCRGCPRRSTDMARNGSCLAHVPPGADGREAGDPGGRRLHTRGDGGVTSSYPNRTRTVEISFGLTRRGASGRSGVPCSKGAVIIPGRKLPVGAESKSPAALLPVD